MHQKVTKPKIVVFAGPNGSGKSTITGNTVISGEYINADDISADSGLSAMDAAIEAESRRENALKRNENFTFETVLSTNRNLKLLKKAKEQGYFIRGYYVLTCSADINVFRVKSRVEIGKHDVPEDKIRSRYTKSLALLPEFIKVCDICSIYDNSGDSPVRIYKKHDTPSQFFVDITATELWERSEIEKLVNMK